MTEAKPLHPMNHGSILIVGAKVSNFSEEIVTNPRVILWDSQDQKWESKEVPQNTQAIFITRFIGHKNFDNIMRDARKRRITIFTPQGTGMITKQVKELLGMNGTIEHVVVAKETPLPVTNPMTHDYSDRTKDKLKPIKALLDLNKSTKENADIMFAEAQKLGIKTTFRSLTQIVYVARKKAGKTEQQIRVSPAIQKDVVVEMLDGMIKEMKDVREYLVATIKENMILKARIEKFKKSLTED